MGRDRSPGQEQMGGDLRVGQAVLYELSDLGLCRRQAFPSATRLAMLRVRATANAVRPEPSLDPCDVGGRPEIGVDLHGLDECISRLRPIAVLDQAPGSRLQRLSPQQRAVRIQVALR